MVRRSAFLLLIFAAVFFTYPASGASDNSDTPPSFSLVAPDFLSEHSPLNSSVEVKVSRWDFEIAMIEPDIISFADQECSSPPRDIFSWVEDGVTFIAWKSRVTLLCRYIVYRAEPSGNFVQLNSVPVNSTVWVDNTHADPEHYSYHVESVNADGIIGDIGGPAEWMEPEIIPNVGR